MIATLLDTIADVLRHTRFNYSNESELQQGVAEALTAASIAFEREKRLDAASRIDFFFPAGVGLECKVKGSAGEITRQVHRYMQHPEIVGLVLLSRRANVHSIPDTLNEKPIRIVSLWSQSL